MVFRSFTLLILLGLCRFAAVGQSGPGWHWHFGQGNALFITPTTVAQPPGSLQSTFEGCATISTASGQLLYYTNGGGRDPLLSGQSSGKIWNSDGTVVYDMGNTQGGGFSAAQSSVFIPKPGGGSRYYLFTMEEIEFDVGGAVPGQPQGRGLSWFELNSAIPGTGAALGPPTQVYAPSYEGLCAIRHQNNLNYWIVINDAVDASLRIYGVTSAGVQYAGNYFPGIAAGIIKGATDRKWIAIPKGSDGVQLLRFNAATGVPEAPILLQEDEPIWAVEFSPSSRYLYAVSTSGNGYQVRRYDLNSADIPGSSETVAAQSLGNAAPIIGQMQVAADGRIYFVERDVLGGVTNLDVIACPDSPAPSIVNNAFSYPADGSGTSPGDFFGLPNFDNALFYIPPTNTALSVSISPNPAYACENRPATLQATLTGGPATYAWSTGATTPTITASEAGIYSVTVTDGCGTAATDEVEVLDNFSAGTAPPALRYCIGAGDTLRLAELLTGEDTVGVWSEVSAAPSSGGAFDAEAATFILANQLPGVYRFRYSTPPVGACLSDQSTLQVEIGGALGSAGFDLRAPACPGDANGFIRANNVMGGFPPFEYALDGGAFSATDSFPNLAAGVYALSIRDGQGCRLDTTLTLPEPTGFTLALSPATEITLVRDESVQLTVTADPPGGAYTYAWQPADGLSCADCPSPVASPRQTVDYLVTVLSGLCADSLRLRINVSIPKRVYLPNAFSPNDDGVNDRFALFSDEGVTEVVSFAIFDRWGELVFSRSNLPSNELSQGWDGRFRGEPAPAGAYLYTAIVRFEDGSEQRYDGNVTLVR
jgi:gliding motility-associated-like protein